MRPITRRFNSREWNTIKSLQKYKHVPYLFGRNHTHMFMEKYETDLFKKTISSSIEDVHRTVDARFCSTLFQFLDNLHSKEGIYHGDINPKNICLKGDSWALINWESARPHDIRTLKSCADYRVGAKGDVYSAAMSIIVARNGWSDIHLQVHELTDGIFCSAYMYGKDWESILSTSGPTRRVQT